MWLPRWAGAWSGTRIGAWLRARPGTMSARTPASAWTSAAPVSSVIITSRYTSKLNDYQMK